MKLAFTKMHGLGNNFILIDGRRRNIRQLRRLAEKLCDRSFGVGADQLLYLCNSRKADYRLRIFNADGSEVEMCGNGIRCLAKYIWESNITPAKLRNGSILSIETLAGIIHPSRCNSMIKVDMGEPVFDRRKIPVKVKQRAEEIITFPVKVDRKTYLFTAVSMGNPHAVTIVSDVDTFPVNSIGPIVEKHRAFPNRTNVEFSQILNRRTMRVRVWERGAGETMACGTGASAAAVVSAVLGHTERSVSVRLPGGTLSIEWSDKDNHVFMTGPATKVCEGTIEL